MLDARIADRRGRADGIDDNAVPRRYCRTVLRQELHGIDRRAIHVQRALDDDLGPGRIETGDLTVAPWKLHNRAGLDRQRPAIQNRDVTLDDVRVPRRSPRRVGNCASWDHDRTRNAR